MRRAMTAVMATIALSACTARDDASHTATQYAAGHFAVGTPATPAQIAAWNTDIGPEGLELPAGRGSALQGATIYSAQCAACHGAQGQGFEPLYPALIGRPAEVESFDFSSNPKSARTIGNYWSHATTLYDYIRRAMPLYTPGSLSADETYAVVAYLLAANKVIADTAVLDAAALRAVVMPARDRFVPDDRSPSKP
jgi:mono/diheme cytochrome c family protein